MTLSEIETILEQLAVRHTNLDTELLTTLLTASGWEDKVIKDALVLFSQRKPKNIEVTAIQTSSTLSPKNSLNAQGAPIVFYHQDGNEEGKLYPSTETAHTLTSGVSLLTKNPSALPKNKNEVMPEVTLKTPKDAILSQDKNPPPLEKNIKENKEYTKDHIFSLVQTEPTTVGAQPTVVPLVIKDDVVESLIVKNDEVKEKREKKDVKIPDNLPLLPFESSPHVWSFSKYKDFFYKEEIPSHQKTIELIGIPHEVENMAGKDEYDLILKKVLDEEIIMETVPLNRQDESLVFLAGAMLLVIILILGYMYSNGRL